MRNPGRSLLTWLAVAILGSLAIYASFGSSRAIGEDWIVAALGVAGVIMVPLGVVYTMWALALLRGRSKLRGGHRLLARWHVSPEEWRRFIAFDRIRAASAPGLANDFRAARIDADRGVELLVGETGIAIGDYYQALRRGGLPGLHAFYWLPDPADPQCLEFHVVYPRRFGPGTRLCVRAPVAGSAHEAARRVQHHFDGLLRPMEPLALRNPALTIRISMTVALVFGLGAAWGILNGRASGDGIMALMTGVISAIIAVTALAFAATTMIMTRRKAGR
jgi:hypothetical protein